MMEETGPRQLDGNQCQAKLRGSQHGDPHWSSERREGRERSVCTTHTSKSHSRGKSHVSHVKNDRDLQRKIDVLKRELRHAWRERSPPDSEPLFEGTDGASYRQRSRTPPSKTFSYEGEHDHQHRHRSSPSKGLGNSAMNKALSQVSKSPFTRNIEVQLFLGSSTSLRSLCTMGGQTQWSTLAIFARKWLSIPETKPWCARFFHQVWVRWWWGGSMG